MMPVYPQYSLRVRSAEPVLFHPVLPELNAGSTLLRRAKKSSLTGTGVKGMLSVAKFLRKAIYLEAVCIYAQAGLLNFLF